MRHFYLKTGLPLAASLLLLTGCVDDNYDLSDIDTTTQLAVNDLTIPIRFEPITLDNVLDIDEDDPDAMIIIDRTDPDNPVYAVQKKGEVTANATTIGKVTAPATEIQSTADVVTGSPVDYNKASKGMRAPGMAVHFPLRRQETFFEYTVKDIDPALYSIESVKIENSPTQRTVLSVRVGSRDLAGVAQAVRLENVKFIMPENSTIEVPANCTFKDGILTVPVLEADPATGYTDYFNITVTGFIFPSPLMLKNYNQYDVKGTCKIKREVGIGGADLYVVPKSAADIANLPTSISMQTDYLISDLQVDAFSGYIRYAIDIDGIDDVDLSNVPKFLAGDETNIRLYDPKFTLTVNNPVGPYNMAATSGLTLIPHHEGDVAESPIILNEFTVGSGAEGPWTVVMGPRVTTSSTGFTNSYNFPGLSNILSGKGLPRTIGVELTSQQWPEAVVAGNANMFPLGKELEQIKGEYTFYTPIALCDGSTIVYTKEDREWDSEDLKKVKASMVKVSGVAVTNIPASVQLSISLLDREGNIIPAKAGNSFTVPANATASTGAFELILEPANPAKPFTDIDGISITAIATQTVNGAPLKPSQTITLNDIRFKVTGNYTTDF